MGVKEAICRLSHTAAHLLSSSLTSGSTEETIVDRGWMIEAKLYEAILDTYNVIYMCFKLVTQCDFNAQTGLPERFQTEKLYVTKLI